MGLTKEIISNQEIFLLDGKRYTGKVEVTYDNTSDIKLVAYFSEGLKTGEWYYFYEEGNTEKVETYENGLQNGLFRLYYDR